jgi:hypothetical protein
MCQNNLENIYGFTIKFLLFLLFIAFLYQIRDKDEHDEFLLLFTKYKVSVPSAQSNKKEDNLNIDEKIE